MNPDANTPPTLLFVHDGELDDLRPLLAALGTPVVERRGGLERADRATRWDLVVATARQMLSPGLEGLLPQARIAILDAESETLRSSLYRAGVPLVVRRPVHPAALRALILHAIYRGPERRNNPRVYIGATVHLRVGWRRRPAVLADLSFGGCRVLTPDTTPCDGDAFALHVPASVAGGRAFSVRARVLTVDPAPGEPRETRAVTARFEHVNARLHAKLERAVALHARGPAAFEPVARKPDAPEVPGAAPREQRQSARYALERRVIALGDEAARVLMGLDISVGGMRVQPNPRLRLGEELRLAIQLADRDQPLVVRATVHRDDGPRGVALRFHALSEEAVRYLTEAMEALPLVGSHDGEGYLVTEILEAR